MQAAVANQVSLRPFRTTSMWAGLWVRPTEFVHISELLPGSGRRARGPDPFRTRAPNLAHALSSSGRNRGSEICFPSLRCGMGASRSGVPPAREERQVARPPVCHSPSVACCAGQKTPSGSRQSQPYSARNVLPLQPLGPIPGLGLLLFARYDGAQYTLVAVNTTGNEQTVPFWFPVGGDYREELHGGDLDLEGAPALKEHALTIPTHYGRIWTRASANPHASIPSPSFAPGNRFVRADPAKDPKKLGRARRT